MLARLVFLLSLLGLGLAACNQFQGISDTNIKLQTFKLFNQLPDTSGIGITAYSDGPLRNWKIAYNVKRDSTVLYFYDMQMRRLAFSYREPRPESYVKSLTFHDVTGDGESEMVLILDYDEGISYHRTELLIYDKPFDKKGIKLLLDVPLRQSWGQIEEFDTMGNPAYNRKVEYALEYVVNTRMVALRGTWKYKPGMFVEYTWDDGIDSFVVRETQVQQSEIVPGAGSASGKKSIVSIGQRRANCQSMRVLDAQKMEISLPENVEEALNCAGMVALSPDASTLYYEDKSLKQVLYYNFAQKTVNKLLDNATAIEGVSDPIWSRSGQTMAIVVVNQDEFIYDTRLFLKKSNGKWAYKDLKINYTCVAGRCAAQAGQDFRFDGENDIIYKPSTEEVERRVKLSN
jgi:hypothetical protein